MADSNIETIVDNLKTQLELVDGIIKVERDPEGIVSFMPPNAQECPAILIESRKPAVTRLPIANGLTQYIWHFDLILFYCVSGVKTPATRVSGARIFFPRISARLNAHNTLSGACTSVQFNSEGDLGYFSKYNADYFGWVMHLDIFEDVAETYAA